MAEACAAGWLHKPLPVVQEAMTGEEAWAGIHWFSDFYLNGFLSKETEAKPIKCKAHQGYVVRLQLVLQA
jgi:hypothetical protein